jgi:hexosaminidase
VDYEGKFELSSNTRIFTSATDEGRKIGEYLAGKLRPSTGFALPIVTSGTPTSEDISLRLIAKTANLPAAFNYGLANANYATVGDEGYRICVDIEEGVVISAYTEAGLFRGVQTIRQLLPPDIEKQTLVSGAKWLIPYCHVLDYPRYEFRSVMIDICRHYHSPERVKRQIDIMAQFKMNVMHLHMTEDQGFRIASDTYPQLNTFGGALGMTSTVGSPNFGQDPRSWTKEEFADVIAYAAERYIDVVPEIEFPSHDSAQLISLPLLNNNGTTPDNSISNFTGGSVGYSITLDPNVHKYTREFMVNIINEIAAQTKSQYIHIGGDEANNMSVAAYATAVQPVIDAVHANGKKAIQWNQASSNNNNFPFVDVLQNWAQTTSSAGNYSTRALQQGSQILASIAERAYYDHATHRSTPWFGMSWANSGGVSIHTAYMWDPEEAVPAAYRNQGRVIGVDAPLWAENLGAQFAHDSMIYPRLLGLSELGWSPFEDRTTGRPSATANTEANLTAARTNAAYLNYENRIRNGGYNFRLQNQGVVIWNHPQLWAAKSVDVPTKTRTVSTSINTAVNGSITWTKGANAANDNVTLLLGAEPTQGTVTFDQSGNWIYTPKQGFIGSDGFTILFNVDGYGIPLNTSPAPGSGVTAQQAYHQVTINVTGVTGTTYPITASLIATSSTITRIAFDPPHPGLAAANFSIPGATIRRAVTLNNGSSYVVFTSRRNETSSNVMSISRTGYTYNTVPLTKSQNIKPAPQEYVDYESKFQIKATTKIFVPGSAVTVGENLAASLYDITGFDLPVVTAGTPTSDDINLRLVNQTSNLPVAFNYGSSAANYNRVGDEGYRIYADVVEGVVLSAYGKFGLEKGVQAISQLVTDNAGKWNIPYCNAVLETIKPVFTNRGGLTLDHLTDDYLKTTLLFANDPDQAVELTMVVAIKNSKGKLVCSNTDTKVVAAGGEATFQVELELPDNINAMFYDQGYQAEVYLWDSGTFIPVRGMMTFK